MKKNHHKSVDWMKEFEFFKNNFSFFDSLYINRNVCFFPVCDDEKFPMIWICNRFQFQWLGVGVDRKFSIDSAIIIPIKKQNKQRNSNN